MKKEQKLKINPNLKSGELRRKAKKKLTMQDTVQAALNEGYQISYKLEPKVDMPHRFPNDPLPVRALVEESERMNALGNKWTNAKEPNPIAADMAFRNGWGFALAAAYLRCYLKGELEKKPPVSPYKALTDDLIETATQRIFHQLRNMGESRGPVGPRMQNIIRDALREVFSAVIKSPEQTSENPTKKLRKGAKE